MLYARHLELSQVGPSGFEPLPCNRKSVAPEAARETASSCSVDSTLQADWPWPPVKKVFCWARESTRQTTGQLRWRSAKQCQHKHQPTGNPKRLPSANAASLSNGGLRPHMGAKPMLSMWVVMVFPYCGWTKSCTTLKPWNTYDCRYQGNHHSRAS